MYPDLKGCAHVFFADDGVYLRKLLGKLKLLLRCDDDYFSVSNRRNNRIIETVDKKLSFLS